jgi:hypothetical protein
MLYCCSYLLMLAPWPRLLPARPPARHTALYITRRFVMVIAIAIADGNSLVVFPFPTQKRIFSFSSFFHDFGSMNQITTAHTAGPAAAASRA